MRWTERQQALLGAMGLRLWWPQDAGAPADERPSPAAGAATVAAAPAAPTAPTATVSAAAPAAGAAAAVSAPPPLAVAPGAPAAWPVLAPDLSPVATMGWDSLASAVAACEACGLCRTRRQTVFGVGHRQAHCMVVGEAPGEQEDRQGEPFVGAAGQLLDRMLAAIGLSRDGDDPARSVFIANTLKCRPPGNRNPSPEELAQCVPFLQRQVALVQPKVILAMGRFAVQALLQSAEPLGRLRGQVHQWQGRPLVVTYHPAYLLRQPADKARAWADLCQTAALLDAAAEGRGA